MKRRIKIFGQKESGFSLIEVLIAIAVIGIFVAALVTSLSVGLKVLLTTDIQETARDLAEAQIENIQTQPYDVARNPPIYPALVSVPDGFTITVTSARSDRGGGTTNDTGIQDITVSVKKEAVEVFKLEGQKVKW